MKNINNYFTIDNEEVNEKNKERERGGPLGVENRREDGELTDPHRSQSKKFHIYSPTKKWLVLAGEKKEATFNRRGVRRGRRRSCYRWGW